MNINILLTALAIVTTLFVFARTVLAQGQENKIALDRSFGSALTHRPRSKFWAGDGTMTQETIDIAGIKREYYLYIPAHLTAKASLPTVFAFHGGGGTARGMDRICGGLTPVADREGFVIVFPQGLKHHWNDGREANASPQREDVKFIAAAIDRLVANGTSDRTKIYATGISNGGFFSQYLALMLPDRFAAVASVAATFPDEKIHVESNYPVPIAFFLGTKDPIVPWSGGIVGFKSGAINRGPCLSGPKAVQFWLDNNRTSNARITDKVLDDGQIAVARTDYGDPGSQSEVVLYRIEGGGHTWPGGCQYLPSPIVGRVCRELNANQAILRFFQQHRLQA